MVKIVGGIMVIILYHNQLGPTILLMEFLKLNAQTLLVDVMIGIVGHTLM